MNHETKKTILSLIIAILMILGLFLTASAQTPAPKPDTKIYYVAFSAQQYQSFQQQALHADSLLAFSDAKSKDSTPALNVIGMALNLFQQAYLRKDTLITTPLKKKQ